MFQDLLQSFSSYIEKGKEVREKKNFEESLAYFDKALKICPHSTEAFDEKSNFFFILKEKVNFTLQEKLKKESKSLR